MGTRHIITVVLGGQYKVAQYGQWDGYPGGQGRDVLKFLAEDMNRALFESKVRALRFNTPEEDQAEWVAAGADPNDEYTTIEVADMHKRLYPQNSRDTGAGILKIIQDSPEGMGIQDDLGFVADSLMCEWVYVIDLDRNTFEVFNGFNKTPLGNGERFFFLMSNSPKSDVSGIGTYYPCKMIAVWSLSKLPTEDMFLRKSNPGDEEYDELPDGQSGMEPGLSGTDPNSVVKPEDSKE